MKRLKLAATLFVVSIGIAVAAVKSPEQAWRQGIAEANQAYSKIPHAILKIQDAAYLGEGATATLVGTHGKPDSYHWVRGKADHGALFASFRAGHTTIEIGDKVISETASQKSVPVDANIDIAVFRTQVSAGVFGVRIMLYNQIRAAAVTFKGLDYFPYDPTYVVTATFKPDPKFPPRVFRTSRGTDKQFFHAGDATFVLKGKTFTLPFYADDPKNVTDMSAFFMDDLTGRETYGAGRYVDISDFGSFPPKTATIDFNNAYNPNCARSAFYTCPVATDVIALAVRAGEKDPHAKH